MPSAALALAYGHSCLPLLAMLLIVAVNGQQTSAHGATWHSAFASGTRGSQDIGETAFNDMFASAQPQIAWRRCDSCSASHQDIFYKRHTAHGSFNAYQYLVSTCWLSTSNARGTDFDLYSTYADAIAGTNAWSYCNYDDCTTSGGVRAFRDCGPTGAVASQWYPLQANTEFYILLNPPPLAPPSTPPPAQPPPPHECSLPTLPNANDAYRNFAASTLATRTAGLTLNGVNHYIDLALSSSDVQVTPHPIDGTTNNF